MEQKKDPLKKPDITDPKVMSGAIVYREHEEHTTNNRQLIKKSK